MYHWKLCLNFSLKHSHSIELELNMVPSDNMYFSILRDCSQTIYLQVIVKTSDLLKHHNCFIVLVFTHLKITGILNTCRCSKKDAFQMYCLCTSVSVTVLAGFLCVNARKAFHSDQLVRLSDLDIWSECIQHPWNNFIQCHRRTPFLLIHLRNFTMAISSSHSEEWSWTLPPQLLFFLISPFWMKGFCIRWLDVLFSSTHFEILTSLQEVIFTSL